MNTSQRHSDSESVSPLGLGQYSEWLEKYDIELENCRDSHTLVKNLFLKLKLSSGLNIQTLADTTGIHRDTIARFLTGGKLTRSLKGRLYATRDPRYTKLAEAFGLTGDEITTFVNFCEAVQIIQNNQTVTAENPISSDVETQTTSTHSKIMTLLYEASIQASKDPENCTDAVTRALRKYMELIIRNLPANPTKTDLIKTHHGLSGTPIITNETLPDWAGIQEGDHWTVRTNTLDKFIDQVTELAFQESGS